MLDRKDWTQLSVEQKIDRLVAAVDNLTRVHDNQAKATQLDLSQAGNDLTDIEKRLARIEAALNLPPIT